MIDSYRTGSKHTLAVTVNFCAVPKWKGKILKISFIFGMVFIIVSLFKKPQKKIKSNLISAYEQPQTTNKQIYKIKTKSLKII